MTAHRIPVEDRLDIMELFARYAWGLNTGDADAVVACFAEDGYLEHQPQGRFSGERIRDLLAQLWYDKAGWFIGRQHLANHFLMTPEGPDVRVKAFFSILQHNLDYRTNFVFGLGNWDNLCTKVDGGWLFKSLTVVKWMGEEIPWVGEDRARAGGPRERSGADVPRGRP
ncbi:MAG TPA: nuclear transport factor 2 family protein [Amycolatopsis sp.]|jgi:hypothetical protein|nr:nuclear transport factor 2 family protein [Amycolatopsis sp.]